MMLNFKWDLSIAIISIKLSEEEKKKKNNGKVLLRLNSCN